MNQLKKKKLNINLHLLNKLKFILAFKNDVMN